MYNYLSSVPKKEVNIRKYPSVIPALSCVVSLRAKGEIVTKYAC